MKFPFLHPAWLGIALAVALILPAIIPAMARRWWLVVVVAVGVSSLAASLGLVPWIGYLQVTAYGICLILAVGVAYWLISLRAPFIQVSERQVADLCLIALAAGLIGARTFEVMDHWSDYAHPGGQPFAWSTFLARAPDIDQGGMVWYGGAIFGAAAGLFYTWRCRIPWLPLADVVMPALLMAQAIGRVGCYFNGCCYGAPCDLPWAISAPGDHGHVEMRHPTQFYETIACLMLAGACWWWWRRRRSDGQVAFVAVCGYALWRFINEALREDKVMTTFWGLFPISTAQVISLYLLLAASAVALMVWWRRYRNPERHLQAHRVPGSRHASACPAISPVEPPQGS